MAGAGWADKFRQTNRELLETILEIAMDLTGFAISLRGRA